MQFRSHIGSQKTNRDRSHIRSQKNRDQDRGLQPARVVTDRSRRVVFPMQCQEPRRNPRRTYGLSLEKVSGAKQQRATRPRPCEWSIFFHMGLQEDLERPLRGTLVMKTKTQREPLTGFRSSPRRFSGLLPPKLCPGFQPRALRCDSALL